METRRWKKVRILAKGRILKDARIEQGYSAKNFAALVGVSKQQIYVIEKGTSGVSEKTAAQIARRLGMSFNELFDIVWPNGDEDTPSIDPVTARTQRQLIFDN